MGNELDPEFLDERKLKMKDKNTPKPIQGSVIRISTFDTSIRTLAVLDPLGCRKCVITLVKGSVKQLRLLFGYVFY